MRAVKDSLATPLGGRCDATEQAPRDLRWTRAVGELTFKEETEERLSLDVRSEGQFS
jgi:hypothetical protein